MRRILISAAFLAGTLLSLPTLAATVTSVEGRVSINRGTGFQRVTGTANANVGDTVMAGPNGAAQIVYADGCSVPVIPGKLLTITAQPPCKGFAQLPGEEVEEDNTSTYVIVGGALAVGIGVGAYFLLQQKDDDKPFLLQTDDDLPPSP